MTFRLLLGFALLILPASARAADCLSVRTDFDDVNGFSVLNMSVGQDDKAIAACGKLRIIQRRRDDPRPDVHVTASYVEFEAATGPMEARYNEWIRKRVEEVPLTGPFEGTGPAKGRAAYFFFEDSLYRSNRLLSASVFTNDCCRAHEYRWSHHLNIDPKTGHDVQLDDLVEIAPVADTCWKMFAELTGPMQDQGKIFSEQYPRSDFATILRRAGWSVQQGGLAIDFAFLLGYVGAEFGCQIRNEDLPRFVKAGVSVPL